MEGERRRSFASLEEARAAAATRRGQLEKEQRKSIQVVDLLDSSEEEGEVSARNESSPMRPDTTSSSHPKTLDARRGMSPGDPICLDTDDSGDSDVPVPKSASRTPPRQQKRLSGTSSLDLHTSSATLWGYHPRNPAAPVAPEPSDGRKPPTASSNLKTSPFSTQGRHKKSGSAPASISSLDPGENHSTMSGPGFASSLPTSEMEYAGAPQSSLVQPRTSSATFNLNPTGASMSSSPFESRFSPVASSNRRKPQNRAMMGALSIVRNSSRGVVKLGIKDKRKSSLSGYRPGIIELSDTEELPFLPNQRRIPLPRARSKDREEASPLGSPDPAEEEEEEPQESPHEVIYIEDESDDEVPEEAFSPTKPPRVGAMELGPMLQVDAEKGPNPNMATSAEEHTDGEECIEPPNVAGDANLGPIMESRTINSQMDSGDSNVVLPPNECSEAEEPPKVEASVVASHTLHQVRVDPADGPSTLLDTQSKSISDETVEEADAEMKNKLPLLSERAGIQNTKSYDLSSEQDARGDVSGDDHANVALSDGQQPADETTYMGTIRMEEMEEDAQTRKAASSAISQHTMRSSVVRGSDDEMLRLRPHSSSDGIGQGDTISSPDETVDLDVALEGEDGSAVRLEMPYSQMEDLLKPPPLARIHELAAMLKTSENKSQWLWSIERTQGVNVIEEWYSMARRLRECQPNENEEDDYRSTLESGTDKKIEGKRPLEIIPKGDKNFRGGVDGPVDTSEDVGSLCVMRNVPMLDETYCDKTTGLPARRFSVVGMTDKCIYSFLVRARKSSIPNAGNGLFLAFLGAKEVKPSKQKRYDEILNIRRFIHDRYGELQAVHPDGFGMNLNVTGEHIKSRYNSTCPLPKLKAIMPKNGCSAKKRERETTLTFSDPDLPYDEDELEALRKPDARMGHAGLLTIDDYVDAPRRKFSSLYPECGFVEIGRYGPFRKEDRKVELHFQAKTFIFGFEPSMWGFGVKESIRGRGQTVDITDDLTGEPHETAQQSLPMYVNEVGHSDLEENVHACEENGRVIKYFFVIRKPMKKGDELELFVNYRKAYEENRERKGYGKNKDKGDDHFPSRLARNFPERENIIIELREARMCDFAMVVEFCATLAQPLHDLLDSFLRDVSTCLGPFSSVAAKQLMAVRRLEWISSICKFRLEEMRNPSRRPLYELGVLDEHYAFQCHENLTRMAWGKWSEIFSVLERNPLVRDKKGNVLWDELRREAMEEVCFEVCNKVLLPFDESRWCPIALEVMQNLCVITAQSLWSGKKSSSLVPLSQQFIEIAKKAADEIKVGVALSRLAFSKDFEDLFVFDEPGSENTIGKEERVVVLKRNNLVVCSESDKSASAVLTGRRATLNDRTDHGEMIHTTWYLARQIFFVVDSIAQFAFGGTGTYSRELLLMTIGLDAQTASLAMSKAVLPRRGLRSDYTKYPRFKSEKQTGSKSGKGTAEIAAKARRTVPIEKASSSLFWNIIWPALKNEHGWTLIHGKRPNDFYACPRGVVRGQKGFRNRIHYFDSVPLIIDCLQNDPTWSTNPDIRRCMDEYDKCGSLYKKVRGTRNMPKFGDRKEEIKWLREQVQQPK